MLSIVICSINTDYLSKIKENISSTIGVEYELLVWNNLPENKGICEVYNMMAAKAKFEYICFVHEDLDFQTRDWGKKLVSLFESNTEIGVIGVAGCKYKSRVFSGWYTAIKELDCCNIIHRFPWGDELLFMKPDDSKMLEEVVCLDGVFICCKKQIWQQVKFDETNLTGFHFYDIDFSLKATKYSAVVVTYEIDIMHITLGGDFGEKWVETCISYHLKNKGVLPYDKLSVVKDTTDKRIQLVWLDVLKNYKISWRNKWRWVALQNLFRHTVFFYPVLRFFLYRPTGARYFHRKYKARIQKKKQAKK
jgi:hypothetical protein